MSRDERLTTMTDRAAMRQLRPAEIGTAHVRWLLDDIDARIERERKLREALRLMQTAHRQCFGSEAIGDECRLCLLKRILAETADDE